MTADIDLPGLAACPFCGAGAAMHRDENIFARQSYPDYPNQNHGFRVECAGKCHSMTCWWHTEDQAVTAWNTRTIATPVSLCGVKVKALEWEPDLGLDGEVITDMARTPFGQYFVERDTFSAERAYETTGPNGFRKRFAKESDAFAAAQADFDQRIRSALAPGVASEPKCDAAGWLIEKDDPPIYCILSPGNYDEHWTDDASKALRFSRREDAQAFADHTGWTSPPVRVVEHMWPVPGAHPDIGSEIRAIIEDAMLGAWDDICGDTGCHPLDITHGKGKRLYFQKGHWARLTAKLATGKIHDALAYADLRASGGIAPPSAAVREALENAFGFLMGDDPLRRSGEHLNLDLRKEISTALSGLGESSTSSDGPTLEMEMRRADDNARSCKHFLQALEAVAANPEQAREIASRATTMPWITECMPADPAADREAVARALQGFWQGPSGRSWDETKTKLPAQADWFLKLADVAILSTGARR